MNVYQNSSYSMGTRFNLLLPGVDKPEGDRLFSFCLQELSRMESMLSCFIEDSLISQINRHAFDNDFKVTGELFEILEDCRKCFELTQGAFDIGLGKLIDHWNGKQNSEDIDVLTREGSIKNIILDKAQKTIRFKSPNVKLNLGGYGKGYALERIQNLLTVRNISSAFISFGESSICCIGKHPYGDYWSIGIQDFYQKEKSIATLKLVDQSVSTSANMEVNNHVINPRKGKPVVEKVMITVKSNSATEAEVLSTALMVADESQWENIQNAFLGIEILKVKYKNKKAEILKNENH